MICFNGSNYAYTITISTDEFYNVFKILDFMSHNKAFYIGFGNGFWKVNPKILYFTKNLLSLFGSFKTACISHW